MGWWPIARTTDVSPGEGRAFEVAGRTIALFHVDGQWHAIEDQCPHMGASLAAGYLDGCVVACPWHAWRFDIRDGSWCDNPRVKIDAYRLKVEAEEIWVELPGDPPSR
jgi:nitrite reductase (NADH) small subunit